MVRILPNCISGIEKFILVNLMKILYIDVSNHLLLEDNYICRCRKVVINDKVHISSEKINQEEIKRKYQFYKIRREELEYECKCFPTIFSKKKIWMFVLNWLIHAIVSKSSPVQQIVSDSFIFWISFFHLSPTPSVSFI